MKVIPIVTCEVEGKSFELHTGGGCEECAATPKSAFCGDLGMPCVEVNYGYWQQRDEDRERAEFEAAAFKLYQEKKAAGKLDTQADQEGDGSPEALFWKQPDGSYGVLAFNSAWWGWQAARGLV